ncbi:peptidoglycan DD-metalloendopeptidase family protein [Dongia soli]|uniref:Peptidoglycan DD-metalloendopeptidase family protein n=1 Tax=Dongia soli TaxID=600628 RepID=A0ABU5ED41_9PROT|nr:peptidoglycan DD-metalloendopeptidase family protein [Dongia soli]MDY0884138.1 peptidoglycan DD-metalloendopeptidase family protein [Dongia soli]
MIKTAMQRIQERLEERFMPRDILIRTNGRVSYLHLSTRRQLLLSALLTGAALIAIVTAAIPAAPQPSFHAREWVGLDTVSPYSDLLPVIGSFAAEPHRDGPPVEPMMFATLRSMPEAVVDLWSSEAAPDQKKPQQASSEDRLATSSEADLTRQLAAQTMEARQLAEKVRMLNQLLSAERQQHQAALVKLATLNDQVTGLQADVQSTDAEKKDLAVQVQQNERALATMIAQRNTLQTTRADMSRSISGLEERLASLQEQQADFVSNLAERARSNMAEMEKTIEMTGLKVDKLLLATDGKAEGQGGPFIPAPASASGKSEQKLMESVASLDDEVGRWEKLQVVLHSLPLTAPVDHYYISSTFGARVDPFNGEKAIHEGVDMVGTLRSDVLATAPGRVVYAGRQSGYGQLVEIDHGFGIHTLYAHLDSIQVKKDQTVDYRDVVGRLGNTGRSSGPHVHYEVRYNERPIDPMGFLKAGRYVFKG